MRGYVSHSAQPPAQPPAENQQACVWVVAGDTGEEGKCHGHVLDRDTVTGDR